ncbi:hypothetical protein HMPREF6745_0521 [Prevotella sp. oral taxon 472 str. F0295]|nr:AAA family ATPase [Prevotella sp. oral taxon 472]EEX53983.1 hypothetical protein HMPREF6745_0521 [Prevotella sp. oral taxon 472 str. F0295]
MKIEKVSICKFRGFKEQQFELGSQLTAIAGQNGTQKSTLLGMITQTFSIPKENPMYGEKPLCGGSYRSAFSEKFRLSPIFDKPKEHEWSLFFDDGERFDIESIVRKGEPNVRFWRKGSRGKGDGYKQFPTIFLSLKRLVPLAEEKDVDIDEALLCPDEVDRFKKLHNRILISNKEITSTTGFSSTNKQSMGVSTALYDWNQNSMGQDNLSKILLALFSFRRLKDKFPNDYQGGILAIDELDATMYPASQVELLKVLKKYASDLNLQIIFTTHSISLLKAVDDLYNEVKLRPETSTQIRVIYLKRSDDNVLIKSDVDFNGIFLDLNVTAITPKKHKNKITVYVEDKETKLFVKAILKTKANCLKFIDVSLPCSTLVEMVTKGVPAFSYPFSIIFLDGDVRKQKTDTKKIANAKNVLLLPGNESPERLVAKFLYESSDSSPLWESIAEGYSKQVCFREIKYEEIIASGEQGRQKAKKWLNSQLQHWGRGGVKVLNPFFSSIQQDVDTFKTSYDNMITHYIHD